MNSKEKHYHQLLQRSFDGDLSGSETEELREWLKSHPEAIDGYIENCQMEAWLHQLGDQKEPEAGRIVSFSPAGNTETLEPAGAKFNKVLFACAVVLPALAVATFFLTQQGMVSDLTGYSQRPNPVDSVARVIRVEGAGQHNEKGKLTAGQSLEAGDRIEMTEGLVEMAFRETGVHVIATAPLSLTTTSREKLYLRDGEVKLVVPPQGIGFVVDTPKRKITDLGTSFVVKARESESKVLVLDGEIAVAQPDGTGSQLMREGESANFSESGDIVKRHSKGPSGVPELPLSKMDMNESALGGTIYGFHQHPDPNTLKQRPVPDIIGSQLLPMIRSGMQNRAPLQKLKQGPNLRFTGIAGTYDHFPERIGLAPFDSRAGWLAHYSGKVRPPKSGRYRFWGYADNHLLVVVDGKPVFEGGRYDSSFRLSLDVPRVNHPSLPCLNSSAGFASGPWIEVSDESLQLDLIFGESAYSQTSAILLIEHEGSELETTFWGQPKWPLFLTEFPTSDRVSGLENLRSHMEEKLMGSFSLDEGAVWEVVR